jgi:uncharacterized protein (DUF1800 family)
MSNQAKQEPVMPGGLGIPVCDPAADQQPEVGGGATLASAAAHEKKATATDAAKQAGNPSGAALALGALATTALTACGGGDSEEAASSNQVGRMQAMATQVLPDSEYTNAWRFLNQASMGPTEGEAGEVLRLGYAGWIDAQLKIPYDSKPRDGAPAPGTYAAMYESFNKPISDWFDTSEAAINEGKALKPPRPYGVIRGQSEVPNHFNFALWNMPLQGQDQLRHRVVYALTQFLVVSIQHEDLGFRFFKPAGYMDMLCTHAFTDFKTIIRGVATSPAMASYLTFFANRPPEPGKRIPDQNFARELLQLFTLGLTKLNMDGTEIKVNKKPVLTTTPEDIAVLSNVFTGWHYGDSAKYPDGETVSLKREYTSLVYTSNPTSPADATLKLTDELVWVTEDKKEYSYERGPNSRRSLRDLAPLRGDLNEFTFKRTDLNGKLLESKPESIHSTTADVVAQVKPPNSQLTLLGSKFEMKSTPAASLEAALNIIFAHPNLAPFVAKQMIQHMVTSNPSPAYVRRVATAFKQNQWRMDALIKAILLDQEARSQTYYALQNTYGRLREPFLRVLGMMRALGWPNVFTGHTNQVTDQIAARNLNHGPLASPSVFNDFSPTYQHAGGGMAKLGKVTPQMQIATETSVIAYINAVYEILDIGIQPDSRGNGTEGWPIDAALSAINSPTDMVNFINKKLFGNGMSAELKSLVKAAGTGDLANKKKDLLKAAIFTAAVSTEYLVQR